MIRIKFRFRPYLAPLVFVLLWPFAAPVFAEIVKSENDPREYEYLVLENGIRALLISDADTKKAAAAVDVNIGNGSDPEDRAGLAHFLEHMLFLGTKKYPDPGAYQSFIKTHGGSHNAYTAFDHTNYFFDIDAGYLEPALDRFAQFFVAPLFEKEFVERERQSVHSEYFSKRKSDANRLWAARKQAFNPNHPAAHFAVGSNTTLADKPDEAVRERLIQFYQQHYSANLMTVVVLGRESLDTLRGWVTNKFGDVQNSAAESLQITQPLFDEDALPLRLSASPEKSQYRLSLVFPVPDTQPYYRAKPLHIIAHLLGHEGEGSLLSWLKKMGWLEGLSAGPGMRYGETASFEVSAALTKSGFENRDSVVEAVFDYLNLIAADGVKSWVFEEQKSILMLGFRFQEPSSAIDTVRGLADRLHRYDADDVLYGPYMMNEFSPRLVEDYLGYLTPDNMMLVEIAPEVKTDETEKWFGTPYKITSLKNKIPDSWRNPEGNVALKIPAKNDFIPTDLALKGGADESPLPAKILSKEGFSLWHRNDQSYATPRASFYLSVRSPLVQKGVNEAVLTALFIDIVNERLNEYSYPATLAGLDYQLYRHQRGFSLRLSGYNDKLDLLLKRILRNIEAPQIDDKVFVLVKNKMTRRLNNKRKDKPYNTAYDQLHQMLMQPYWSDEARLSALSTLTLAELTDFIPQLLSEIDIVALAHGNIDASEAQALGRLVATHLLDNAKPVSTQAATVLDLPAGADIVRLFDTEHNDAAITYYLQGADRSIESRALSYLLAQVLEAPFYHQLRTIKQLGYIVFASAMPILDVPGLAFTVQSPSANSAQLLAEIDQFLIEFEPTIKNMDEQTLAAYKEGLITQILQEDKKLTDRSSRYWQDIDRKEYDFNSQQRLADAVKIIDHKQLLQAYRDYLAPDKIQRIAVVSQSDGEVESIKLPANSLQVDDIAAFKTSQKFYPPL